MHLDNPKKIQWTAHCQNILYNILCALLNTSDYTWILWIILPTLEIPWMLLENCTKREMSESVDCQESISHAGPSCWLQNSWRPKRAQDRFALTLAAGDSFSWKDSIVSAFQWFQEFQLSFAMLQRNITKCGHLQTWKIWTCPFPVFLGFADMCQMFAEFVVGLRVISCDFMGRFQIAHNNPQTPKNTMDIQIVFQIRTCRSFRSVWHQIHSF